MKASPRILCGCALLTAAACQPAGATDVLSERDKFVSVGGQFVRAARVSPPGVDITATAEALQRTGKTGVVPPYQTPLALALTKFTKKSFVELGIEASANMLIECQKETSILLTMPSLRSDSQQAHCYRF